jgi:hypothetical protein
MISTHIAARQARMHPLEFVLRLAPLTAEFNDLFPEVDESYVALVKKLAKGSYEAEAIENEYTAKKESTSEFSNNAIKVIASLRRKKHWGSNTVSEDTLHNHYCKSVSDLEAALRELAKRSLILRKSARGPVSLNPKEKRTIDEIIDNSETE